VTSTRRPETESAAHCRTATPKPPESTCTHASLRRFPASNGFGGALPLCLLVLTAAVLQVVEGRESFEAVQAAPPVQDSQIFCVRLLPTAATSDTVWRSLCRIVWDTLARGATVMQLRHPVHVRYRAMWEQHYALWDTVVAAGTSRSSKTGSR
jgi:hypothetical protein